MFVYFVVVVIQGKIKKKIFNKTIFSWTTLFIPFRKAFHFISPISNILRRINPPYLI